MKNLSFLALVFGLLISVCAHTQVKRCVTSEKMQDLFQAEPQARIRFEATKRMLDDKVRSYLSNPTEALFRTTAVINVPVVVHIMTNNPNLVTDATVQSQIDTLNFYYGNAPAGDSLRVYTPFRSSYGRSQIRFCLAQRTPGGVATNGIERLTTSQTYTTATAHPSTVVPAWNTQAYLNMWIVVFTDGTLGYSYLPGTFAPGDQRAGFVVDYRSFGAGAGYLYPEYNMGRTAVHEIGHYFNLQHPWGGGNSNPTCSGDDGCTDTPPTSGPNFGCPTAVPVTNTCSPGAPGIMWQNHMDYSDDACMNLFTLQQVAIMETAVNTAPDRTGLLTSNGCQPLVVVPDDAGIPGFVSPVNGSVFCGPTLTPVVTLRNYGTNTLTTVQITLTVNGVTAAGYPFTWNGSLASNTSINVTLPAITLASGSNVIVATSSQPNGVADGSTANDASSVTVSMPVPSNAPFFEGFEAATFPPAGWTLNNPDADITWQRYTAAVAATGTGMTRINYYNYNGINQIDELITPPINATTITGNKLLNFARAYRQYGVDPADQDTLEVLVSPDCGATYTSVWKKWGASLATVSGTPTASFSPSSVSDWFTESIDITAFATTGMRVKFKGINKFGNNLFLDNINIVKQADRDIKLVSINSPGATSCTPLITPSLTVTNNGLETITSFDLGYKIGTAPNVVQTFNMTLNGGESATITLTPSVTTAGSHTITAFTANPVSASGTGDVLRSNDTLTRTFNVISLLNPPVVEGFEGVFPPDGWTIDNPDNQVTWIKKSPGRNSASSAFIDNFNNPLNNQRDDIRTPFINVAGADSLVISFDLAYKNYPSPSNSDTLSVLVSNDCGNSFTTVYKKGGSQLATAGSSDANYTAPLASDWRNERISLNNAFTSFGSVNVIIRNTNKFGNNIFLDNINIASVFRRDLQVVSFNQPASVLCTGSFIPSVTVRNPGMETVNSYKVSYSLDNTPAQTITVNTPLAVNAQTVINFPSSSISGTGSHSIKVFSWDPVSSSGIGDNYTYNDTLTKAFALAGTVNAPLKESFESGFPPANWTVVNPDASITWNRYSNGNGNAGAAFLNTFNYSSTGQKDDLVSPMVNFSGVDSVTLTFDVSAVTYSYPGSTGIALDTLEVLLTKDCGATFTTIYKKWGEDLQTVHDPNNPQTTQYFPAFPDQWRKETIDLTGFGGQGPIMLFFRTTNNHENNIFIDNVNLFTRILPDLVKQQGYLVLPSPFRNNFNVWHVQQPTSLKFISVYNSIGQLVWTKQFSGNAQKVENVDLSGKAAGTYLVRLGYTDKKSITERIIKTN